MIVGQRYGQWFMLLASIAVTLFVVASSRKIRLYRAANPSKEVLKKIEETTKDLGCKAHVLPTTVSRTATHLTITINLGGLPPQINLTFILDELYINIQNGGNSTPSKRTSNEELWIEEGRSKALLARVQLNHSRTGYRAVKLRGVFATWLADNQKVGVLKLKLPSTQTKLAANVEKSKSSFVIYAFTINSPVPRLVCASYDITVKSQTPLNAEEFNTKICSRPEEISFPFNASTYFDMGAVLRKSLRDHPVPRNEAVLKNPNCCHATKAISRNFLAFFPKENKISKVELKNIVVTKCGCGI